MGRPWVTEVRLSVGPSSGLGRCPGMVRRPVRFVWVSRVCDAGCPWVPHGSAARSGRTSGRATCQAMRVGCGMLLCILWECEGHPCRPHQYGSGNLWHIDSAAGRSFWGVVRGYEGRHGSPSSTLSIFLQIMSGRLTEVRARYLARNRVVVRGTPAISTRAAHVIHYV